MGAKHASGGVFSHTEVVSVLLIAVVAGSVPALQPVLLGALQAAGRIDASQIGQVATAEALGMAFGATVAAAMFKPRRLRTLALIAIAAIALANAATVVAAPLGIFIARGVNGAASGVVLWILVGMMTRAVNPARIFAVYVTCQGAVAFALSALLTQMVLPEFGASGGYWLLVLLTLLLAGAAFFVPGAFAASEERAKVTLPSAAGFLGLLGVACFLAGTFAFWVYLPVVAEAAGREADHVREAISFALAGQIAGGLIAIGLAGRIGGTAASVGSALGAIMLIAAVALSSSGEVLYAAATAFTMLWMFTPPFQLPMLMQLDPSNRAALFISPAQLGGMAAGPGIAAIWVDDSAYAPAAVAAALFMLSIASLALGGVVRSLGRTATPVDA